MKSSRKEHEMIRLEAEDLDVVRRVLHSYPAIETLIREVKLLSGQVSYPIETPIELSELKESEAELSVAGALAFLPPYYFPITSAEDLAAKLAYLRSPDLAGLQGGPAGVPFSMSEDPLSIATDSPGQGTVTAEPAAGSGVLLDLDKQTRVPAPATAESATERTALGPTQGAATTASWNPRVGYVAFTGLSGWELRDFFVVREWGPPGFFPYNGSWFEADGSWFRPVRYRWFKIPGLCWVEVYRTPSTITYRYWGNPPYWNDPIADPPHTLPPWEVTSLRLAAEQRAA